MREYYCWYFKVNERLSILKEIRDSLKNFKDDYIEHTSNIPFEQSSVYLIVQSGDSLVSIFKVFEKDTGIHFAEFFVEDDNVYVPNASKLDKIEFVVERLSEKYGEARVVCGLESVKEVYWGIKSLDKRA